MSNTKQRCKQINLLHHLKTPNRTPRSIFMLNKRFSKSSKKKKEEKRQENNRNGNKNRIVHESPFLSLLWLKIRNKRNLLKSAITNEYELSAKHGLLNEKYYGNRVSSVLDAWTVNGSWRDTSWIQYQCDDDQRPIGFFFFERRRLLRPHVSLRC